MLLFWVSVLFLISNINEWNILTEGRQSSGDRHVPRPSMGQKHEDKWRIRELYTSLYRYCLKIPSWLAFEGNPGKNLSAVCIGSGRGVLQLILGTLLWPEAG